MGLWDAMGRLEDGHAVLPPGGALALRPSLGKVGTLLLDPGPSDVARQLAQSPGRSGTPIPVPRQLAGSITARSVATIYTHG